MAGDCTKLCCDGFNQTEKTAERVPNPKLRPIDRCNNITRYFGKIGEDFKLFMPVTPTATPGEVEPTGDLAADPIIGIAICAKTSVTDDDCITVARTGVVCWRDMANSLGEDFTDQAKWWEYHVALAKHNIYVEYA